MPPCAFRSAPTSIHVDISCVGYQRLSRTSLSPASRSITLQMQEDAQVISKVEVTAQKRHTSNLQQTATIDRKTSSEEGLLRLPSCWRPSLVSARLARVAPSLSP